MPSVPKVVRKAPVTTLTAAESVTGFILAQLVTHHVITGSTAATWGPFAALAVPVLFGAAKWGLVSPWAKVQSWAEQRGLLTDADVTRLRAELEGVLEQQFAVDLPEQPAGHVAATLADITPHVEAPDGMSAGAPA